ncbi:MAG: hypothetical protein U1E22_08625, partial [Coriobacteriia bacterium]|nr:hypothetical protein [Coriobacteriia bacterium]
EDWSVDLFHDAFPKSGIGSSPEGEFTLEEIGPIETPPILSTDPLGRVTIAISTGEQSMLSAKGRNSVWSLTETRNATGKIVVQVNWVLNGTNAGSGEETHFAVTGERVTGPMALFASTLYFTTYDPGTVDPSTCSPGNSYLWGVHYLQAGEDFDALTPEAADGPLPQLADGSDMVRVIPLPGGLAYGVGVMQKPSCLETDDDPTEDPFLGYGTHKSISSVSPGTFHLIVQMGANQTTNMSKKVDVKTIDLEPPFAGSTIDAWAAILD